MTSLAFLVLGFLYHLGISGHIFLLGNNQKTVYFLRGIRPTDDRGYWLKPNYIASFFGFRISAKNPFSNPYTTRRVWHIIIDRHKIAI